MMEGYGMRPTGYVVCLVMVTAVDCESDWREYGSEEKKSELHLELRRREL